MLDRNESFIIIKLNTGEQLMGILEQEDATHFQILDPMIIRTIPVVNEGREHVTCHPYCQFTSDNIFDIEKKNVIFIKPLLTTMIPHYLRIVKEHETNPALRTNGSANIDDEEISREEAIKRIKMLAQVFGEELEDVLEETEDIPRYFIEGNDTKH